MEKGVPLLRYKKSLAALIFCTLMCAACLPKVMAQEVITLQGAVARTLERNLQIKQAQLTEGLSQENLNQAKYNRLPNLTANPQTSINFGRSIDPSTNLFVNGVLGFSGSLNTQVLIFQGGLLKNLILENKLLVDVDKSTTAKVKNDLTLSVVTTYLQVLTNQDLLSASIQQVDIAHQTLDRVQKNFDVGNNTLADLSQAKAQVATADLNQTTAQNQLDSSILILKQYMEMDPTTPIRVEKPDISKLTDVKSIYDAQQVFKDAVGINPDVHLAGLQQQAAVQNINVAKSYYYPSLSFFASAGSSFSNNRKLVSFPPSGAFDTVGFVNGTNARVLSPQIKSVYTNYGFTNQLSDNFNKAIGVSLQIPIFGRYSTRTNVRKAKISAQIAEVSSQLAKNNLNKTINQAVLDVRAADKKYASAQQTFLSNKEAYNVVQQRYNVGLVNSLDYNTSLTNLNTSQFNMIQAQYELIFRSKIIDYYLGKTINL